MVMELQLHLKDGEWSVRAPSYDLPSPLLLSAPSIICVKAPHPASTRKLSRSRSKLTGSMTSCARLAGELDSSSFIKLSTNFIKNFTNPMNSIRHISQCCAHL